MCNFLGSVLPQQKFEATDQCYSPQTNQCYSLWTDQCYSSQMDQCYSFMLQLSFIQKIKENTSLSHEGLSTQKTQREDRENERERKKKEREHMHKRERPPAFWLLFLYVFFHPSGPALCKLGQPGVLLVLLEVLTLILRPSFVLFSRAFPFLVFQPPPFWTSFPYSNYLTFIKPEVAVHICIFF